MNTPAIAPIATRTLHDELTDRLRTMILDCRLAPGSKVNEGALAAEFQVSRTPLREALRSLAGEGLVLLTPRRGATIAEVTQADLEEAFPILGALEALAGELACLHITAQGIERIRALQAELEASQGAGDLAAYRRANDAIHRLILETAGNATLTRLMQGLDARVRRARAMANLSPERWAQAVAEHAEITEALTARDAERLGAILRRHIANKLAALRAQLAP